MRILLTFLLFGPCVTLGQQKKLAALPTELREISGLERLNDSLFIAINDGGNSPSLFLINQGGKLVKTIPVSNATNVDWEDLAIDHEQGILYIGDFGNNLNQRQNLCFYRVSLSDLGNQDSVQASKINFSYPDQKQFPPDRNNQLFDCEACVVIEGQLYVFCKANDKPYSGQCNVYRIPAEGGVAEEVDVLVPGKQGYFQNSVTAADFLNDRLYLCTYSNIYIYAYNGGAFTLQHTEKFNRLTQKESLVALDAKTLLVADEKSPLFIGQHLYKIHLKYD